MTHADPRKVVAEFADSMATTSRRIGEHGDATAYETLAAQTLHPADILTMARQVGQAMAARGYPEAGACVQLLAEIVDGDCPLHGQAEEQGPPVDGREVDRAPALTAWDLLGIDPDRTPQTGGGAGVVPPDPAPSSPTPAQQIRNDEAARKALDTT